MRVFVVSFLMLLGCLVLVGPVELLAQPGSVAQQQSDSLKMTESVYKFKPQQLIAPAALIGFGAVGTHIDAVKEFDFGFKKVHRQATVAEDIYQYAPAASFYVLKLSGVKSTNNYRDATVILAVSAAVTAVSVKVLKNIAGIERPNGMGNQSFPSGHTATAFMGAEFLRKEYKDSSPWIGIAGYAVATGTALARIKHNEHWFTDTLAGAGIGILSTNVAYWVYPWVQELLFEKIFKCRKDMAFMGMPYYAGNGGGVSLALNF